jgi:CheY-like chemotaxis protein
VVSDIGMPDRDGYQFMRELRGLPIEQGGAIPAIALTAFARSEDRTRAMMAGYQVHIAKPIEPAELLATIASLATQAGKRGG